MFLIYLLSDKPLSDHLIFDMQRRSTLHLYEFVAYIHIQRERLAWFSVPGGKIVLIMCT